jgi:hypothetical protein
MLPPIEDWALAEIDLVTDPKLDETLQLERKASAKFHHSSNAATNETKAEIAKQVCAFANAGGGFLVYGISDAGGRDGGVAPRVGTQPVKDWIEAIVPKLTIPPVINCTARFIEYPDASGRGALILHVPSSEARPHWVIERGRDVPYLRVGAHSAPMSLQTFLDLSTRGPSSQIQVDDFTSWPRLDRDAQGPWRARLLKLIPSVTLTGGGICEQWLVDLSIAEGAGDIGWVDRPGCAIRRDVPHRLSLPGQIPLFPHRSTAIDSHYIEIRLNTSIVAESDATLNIAVYGTGRPTRRTFAFTELFGIGR